MKPDFSSLQNAHGPIPYNMTNDYMFRAVLQSNNKVLRGLICSLLHLKEEDIISVEITNPIILGESIRKKEFRLDINVLLNNYTLINLEMQIANQLTWHSRSLLYLCRSFDRLNRGQTYDEVLPSIHIGFLDYTLFKEHAEFYSTHKLMNVNNHHVYSDNLTLCVIDLSHIDLATKEDRKYHIDYWAKLFKATTREEIIRKQCLDREEYYQDLRHYEKVIAQKDAETKHLRTLLKKHGINDLE